MSKDELIIVFGYLTKRLLGIATDDLDEACSKVGLDVEQIKNKINEINEDLKNF